ncbi:MAG TPA: hypothetical protein VMD91_15975 [Candidatus Sulfotelmatobacter sp.]|nr:hypothetical protein [Candidatus Sulfotelmatobacter sp.]
MFKILPVPNAWVGVAYFLPTICFGVILAIKWRQWFTSRPRSARMRQDLLALSGLEVSLTAIVMSLMHF